jgi:hypothetical protein
MKSPKPTANGRERAKAHRDRLHAAGLTPLQLWIPDTRSAAFRADARRQARAVAESAAEAEDQAFIDCVSVWHRE